MKQISTKISTNNNATILKIYDDGSMELRILCAVCIRENRPSPHRYSFVRIIRFDEYQAQEFYDSEGNYHYHVRKSGKFECTFGHKFERHNLPHVKCPTCGYDTIEQRTIEAEMEICRPPRK